MIKHIVMWKFREGEEAEADIFLNGLKDLYGVIPEIKGMKVSKNILPGGYDAVLEADFESVEDLNKYKADPRHRKVADRCAAIRTGRANVDYEY